MGVKEKFNLELKKEINKSFLKSVSAYANYNTGEIIFGIDDNEILVGMENVDSNCLRIENMINDTIDPIPNFNIKVEKRDEKKIIILVVEKGKDTPYYYRGKAYKRSDTSTLEVDRFELRRLAIEGINMDYEEKKSSLQNLEFTKLESKLKEKAGIEKLDLDVLKTLNLYNKDGYYNIAAELLADINNYEFSGLDIVKFGDNLNKILFRKTISKKSLLIQYETAVEIFKQYYQYEEIENYERNKKELIPKEAVREALANAIVHRIWDTNSYIKISMYEDSIVINSPGGLPKGISKEEYLYGNISVLRNPIIAGVFYRLDIIEKFGTGITRINNEYEKSITKPEFKTNKNSITIKLPVIDINGSSLTDEESLLLDIIVNEGEVPRSQLEEKSGFSKSKTLRIINNLISKNIIKKSGRGTKVTYKKK